MLVATSNSLLIPQLLPASEPWLRIVRGGCRLVQAKWGRSGAALLERDFSDLHTRNRGENRQAGKRFTSLKVLNKVGNTE